MCGSPVPSFILFMRFLIIDQSFANRNKLSIVDALCISVLQDVMQDYSVTHIGCDWCPYTEENIMANYPLIFKCEKRVYKNMKSLSEKGFIEICKFYGEKYFRFTDKCK